LYLNLFYSFSDKIALPDRVLIDGIRPLRPSRREGNFIPKQRIRPNY